MPIIKPSQLTYTHDIPSEWQSVEKAAKLLEEMCLVIGNVVGTIGIKPTPNSTYATDCKFAGDIANSIFASASDLFLLAIDNGRSVARSVEHFPIRLAGFTCGRAVLESCSVASWLVDSDDKVDAEGRIRRYFDFILDGPYRGRRQLDKSENQSLLEISPAEADGMYQAAIENVMSRSDALRIYPQDHIWSGRHPVFIGRPRPTELAGQYLAHGSLKYQWYSAIAHGTPGATDSHWLVKADPNNPYKLMYQPKRAFNLIESVMIWLGQTCCRVLNYLGEDIQDLEDTLEYYRGELTPLGKRAGFALAEE